MSRSRLGDGVSHLYVHLPFCAHRCGYCDFVTVMGRRGDQPRYVDALLTELELECEVLGSELETVYIGGGTPSFTDPAFLAAWAREGGWRGFGDRTESLRVLVPDLLPPEVLERTGKAVFHYAYFRDQVRAFARAWNGAGLDPDLVDAERLREAALQLTPNALTALPLQAAWLASSAGEGKQELEHGVEGVETPRPA